MIYLDNAATTYPKPEVVYKAINDGMRTFSFNSGRGSYFQAQNTYKMITETRNKLGSLVGVSGNQVIFTGSATESLNNIIRGLRIEEGDNVYVSPFEHNAVIRPLYASKANIKVIPFNKTTWDLDVDAFNDMLVINKPKAVIISHISNVTGYELPYQEIFKMSKYYGAINVLDSSQGFGIYHVCVTDVDYLVFAGHKSLYAMFGIAGFIKIGDDDLLPIKSGGTGSDSLNPIMPLEMPSKYEAGSLNSVGIYSINKSIDYLQERDFSIEKKKLAKYLINKLKEMPGLKVYFPENKENCGIISFNIERYSSDEVGQILSGDYDICIRTGYHCAPYVHDFIESKVYAGSIRVSLGLFNTIEDVDYLLNAIRGLL